MMRIGISLLWLIHFLPQSVMNGLAYLIGPIVMRTRAAHTAKTNIRLCFPHLSIAERQKIERLAALVRQKDGLDYHRSLQLALKLWLFVHIPLTYGLMIFTLLHLVLVFGFSGGAR